MAIRRRGTRIVPPKGPAHLTRKQFEAIKRANLAERRASGRRGIPPVAPDVTRVTPRRRRRAGAGGVAAEVTALAFDPTDPVTGVRLCTPVRDQQDGDERCIAFAVAAAMEAAACRAKGTTNGAPELSVEDVFSSAGAQVGAIDTIQAAVMQGVVDATCFPDGAAGRCPNPAPHTWFAKVTAVAGQASKRVQSMRTALETRGPLVTLVEVFANFAGFGGGVPYTASGASAGFHAVCIVGYEVDGNGTSGRWIAKNSMGTSWGDSGFFRIPWKEPKVRPEDVVYVVEGVHQ